MTVCPMCKTRFDPPSTNKKRRTCSRSCANSLSWNEGGLERKTKRCAAMKASKATPEARARLEAHNKRRWADPAQHEKLSQWNRDRWADPKIKARLSVGIRKSNSKKSFRDNLRRLKKELWKNPEYATKHIAATSAALRTPDNKARASAALRKRWQNPVQRAAMLAGHARMLEKNKKHSVKPLTENEIVVLEAIINGSKQGIFQDDLRSLCRDAGVPFAQVERITKSLIIKRKIIRERKGSKALRVEGRGLQ